MGKYFYTYYSYEEFGRGYIGKRECECLPEKDIDYLGSFKDKTFKPTQKIILETFDTVEEALGAECILHDFYEVDINPHFANKARQTSTKFYYITPKEFISGDKNPAKRPEVRQKLKEARNRFPNLGQSRIATIEKNFVKSYMKENNVAMQEAQKVFRQLTQ